MGPWLILFLPLLSAALITFGAHRSKRLSAGLSLAAVWTGFAITCSYLPDALSTEGWALTGSIAWMAPGDYTFTYGYLLDGLGLLMLLVVTGVGGLIHVYSLGYMHDDAGFSRFFACLSLFMFSMLGIVFSDNFFQVFVHWELVGVSSFLLIGYYYEKRSANEAANKAFLTNRVGDFGFMLGILMLVHATKEFTADGVMTASFAEMAAITARPEFLAAPIFEVGGPFGWVLSGETFLWIAGALTFMGVVGKSAQFPLHVWLPDAMEGPTPVSALIHAATMVAAGVFLLARIFFVYLPSEAALALIAHVGAFTAFFAATIATAQYDIKRILAFSTLSQLGYMVMAMGLGGVDVAMFHLSTHAFFKALLFLGAGSVIHAVHSNDIRDMGGLIRRMPITGWTFVIGTLALCGFPWLSGFYSKDGILHLTHHAPGYAHTWMITLLPTLTAVLTAFYMFRCVLQTFFGAPRDAHRFDHAHESPPAMTAPLVVLTVFAVVGGNLLGSPQTLHDFSAVTRPRGVPEYHAIHADDWSAVATSLLIFGLGAGAAFAAFAWRLVDPARVKAALGPVHAWLANRWYVDDLYQWIVDHVQQNVARLSDAFDRYVIIKTLVNGSAWLARATGAVVARYQTGSVRSYALLFAAGVVALLVLAL